jgi:hypothetical protein
MSVFLPEVTKKRLSGIQSDDFDTLTCFYRRRKGRADDQTRGFGESRQH